MIPRFYLHIPIAGCLLLLHSAVVAADTLEILGNLSLAELMEVDIVSVATGTRQRAGRAPAVTSVISGEDLQADRTLAEALESVPGLHVARHPNAYNFIYTLRGIYTEYNPQVLILLNGIPQNRPYTGSTGYIIGNLPVTAVSRIEIIRGPGSALFGADAFSGVINIITKTAADAAGTEAGARGGSFDTYSAWLLHGTEWQGWKLFTSLDYHTTDGHREVVARDAQSQLDLLFGSRASLAPGPVNAEYRGYDWHLEVSKDHWTLQADYQKLTDIGVGAGVSQALDPVGYNKDESYGANLRYHNADFHPDWETDLRLTYRETRFDFNFRNYPPGAFGGMLPAGMLGRMEVLDRNLGAEAAAFYQGWDKHLWRMGIGWRHSDMHDVNTRGNVVFDPVNGIPMLSYYRPLPAVTELSTEQMVLSPKKRYNTYAFVQDIWTLAPAWEMTVGARYDRYSDFGNTFNPRLALVWQPRDTFSIKLLYGHAFRAPSFLELYTRNNPVATGNPDLEAETIATWELAFDYRPHERLQLGLNLFRYRWEDIIRLRGDAQRGYGYVNSGTQTASGFEWEARWQARENLVLSGNYSYVDPEEQNRHPGTTPDHQFYLRADWRFAPAWNLNLQLHRIGERARAAGDSRAALAGYTLLDATLRYQSGKHWQLSVGGRNLTDSDAREPVLADANGLVALPEDLPMAGRHWFGEVRYRY